jgi:hypothetical protein
MHGRALAVKKYISAAQADKKGKRAQTTAIALRHSLVSRLVNFNGLSSTSC